MARLGSQDSHSYTGDDMKVILCCIALHEEPYLDEWITYNLYGVGFDAIHIYDNSADGVLQQLGLHKRYGSRVHVKHFPGVRQQLPAYAHMVASVKARPDAGAVWVAFFDCDEFLVLKRHANVQAFVQEYGEAAGAAGVYINWALFGDSFRTTPTSEPVTSRFTLRRARLQQLGKTICRPEVVDIMECHRPKFLDPAVNFTLDTAGHQEPWNKDQGFDETVAVLNHYFGKTATEFKKKLARGRAITPGLRKEQEFFNHNYNEVFDDSAAKVYALALRRRRVLDAQGASGLSGLVVAGIVVAVVVVLVLVVLLMAHTTAAPFPT